MVLLYLLLALAAVTYYFVNSLKKKRSYWKDRGIVQVNPEPDLLYGDTKDFVLKKRSVGETYEDIYYKFKKMGVKHGGFYDFVRSIWMPIDPSLIKLIVVKDYQYFSAHNPKFEDTLFFNNLFHMDGEPWKDMRKKLTPTFTSGKMKMMSEMLIQKTDGLTDLVGDMVRTGEPTEIKELLARFTTDVIGTCAFGIECDSINDKNSEFFQKGQDIFKRLIPKSIPRLYKIILANTGLIKHRTFELSDIENFFRKIVNETVRYREENKIVRKDFMHLLIQLRNKGSITDILNEKDVYQKFGGEEGMSLEDVTGQCLLFFMAGFETSSTTMSFALLDLAYNQDVQAKLRKEIREVLKKYDGVLCYDALQEMTYCDNVIHETLRKYPPVANLPRMCTKNYKIPDSNVEIAKGTTVAIPVFALQRDPEYFPEPEKFIPDRFSPENKSKIVDYTYLPFGEGPRQCLGLRFGMMQTKAGIASLINCYNFTLNKKTAYPPKFSASSSVLSVEGGIWLDANEVK